MDLGIAGRVALVTASSKGLGFATAAALLDESALVMICGRDEGNLATAVERLGEGRADRLTAMASDVTAPEAATRLVDAVVERWGRLDILVANAGGPPRGGAFEVDDEQIAKAFNANMAAMVRLVREAVPHMRAGRWGRVHCITSYTVVLPQPDLVLSNIARTALWEWARAAAGELVDDGITVNLSCPGPHATERGRQVASAARMGEPADFGKVVAFLCSEAAAFVNGTTVVVDGGLAADPAKR